VVEPWGNAAKGIASKITTSVLNKIFVFLITLVLFLIEIVLLFVDKIIMFLIESNFLWFVAQN